MAGKDGKNPWLRISAREYEGHMGPHGVDQLTPLDRIFGEVYAEELPARLLVLGCGTGNGFRHIEPEVTFRAVGVDINPAYVEIARSRFPKLSDVLEIACFYAEKCIFEAESFDLVHSALLLEYVDPELLLRNIASWLAPGGAASFVIQEPDGEEPPVSLTSFDSLTSLSGVMRLLSPEVLIRLASRVGLKEKKSWNVPLKRGKRFFIAVFEKEGDGSDSANRTGPANPSGSANPSDSEGDES